jgi:hypothetical protein
MPEEGLAEEHYVQIAMSLISVMFTGDKEFTH